MPHSVRIEDGLWEAMRAATKRRGETISDVTRRRFEEYIAEPESQPREAE